MFLQKTVDCMTTMSMPSTLVKCLYLFFDLPHMPEVPGATQTEPPLADRRALLQKVFVQVCLSLGTAFSPQNIHKVYVLRPTVIFFFLLRSLWSCASTCLQQKSWPRRMIYSCSSVPSPPGVPPTTFPGGRAPEKCLPPSPDMVSASTSSSTSTVSCCDDLTSFTVVLCMDA